MDLDISAALDRMQDLLLSKFADLNGRIDSLMDDQRTQRVVTLETQRLVEMLKGENEKQNLKIQLLEKHLENLAGRMSQFEKTLMELKVVPDKRDAEITRTVKKWIIGAVGASVTAAVMAVIAKIAGLIK